MHLDIYSADIVLGTHEVSKMGRFLDKILYEADKHLLLIVVSESLCLTSSSA